MVALNEGDWLPAGDLTHISHQFDVWMMDNPLPDGIEAGYDGMVLVLDEVFSLSRGRGVESKEQQAALNRDRNPLLTARSSSSSVVCRHLTADARLNGGVCHSSCRRWPSY